MKRCQVYSLKVRRPQATADHTWHEALCSSHPVNFMFLVQEDPAMRFFESAPPSSTGPVEHTPSPKRTGQHIQRTSSWQLLPRQTHHVPRHPDCRAPAELFPLLRRRCDRDVPCGRGDLLYEHLCAGIQHGTGCLLAPGILVPEVCRVYAVLRLCSHSRAVFFVKRCEEFFHSGGFYRTV